MEQSVPINFINKEFNKYDCYIAELVIDNNLHVPNRTFFPAHWTKEKVISKIHEAYDDFKKRNITPSLNHKKKYIVRGFTSEGIEIEMIFSADDEMKTAYPIID
jgi:hypothetical protein